MSALSARTIALNKSFVTDCGMKYGARRCDSCIGVSVAEFALKNGLEPFGVFMLSRIVSRSALCIALLFLEPWTVVLAQTTTTTQNESHMLIRANDTVSGALSFAAVDVDLPGNDDLPMRIARKFSVESFGGARSSALYLAGAFGDWELDLPMIHGTFSELDGFKVAGPSSLGRERCTGFDEPPPAAGSPDGFFSSHLISAESQ